MKDFISSVSLAPDFARSLDRFEAWWRGDVLDRPPVTIWVEPMRPYTGPHSHHATQRERWLDGPYIVDSAIASMEQRDYVGEALPMFWPNIGPELTATLYGCELDFSSASSWSRPIVHEPEQWEQILQTPPNFDNPYWQACEKMTDLAIERSQGRVFVGMSDLHGNFDILAALRDPQMLCMDLIDCPELIDRVCQHVSAGYNLALERAYRKIREAGYGSSCWTPFYDRGLAYVPSCDFWCMVSAEHADQLVIPRIAQEMELLDHSIFHLDGTQALRHLDRMLGLPRLNAVQWVFGSGFGPASRWIDVYRKILAAGKSIQVLADDMADAMAVVREVGVRGVWLQVGRPAQTVAQAEEFIQDIQRLGS